MMIYAYLKRTEIFTWFYRTAVVMSTIPLDSIKSSWNDTLPQCPNCITQDIHNFQIDYSILWQIEIYPCISSKRIGIILLQLKLLR